MVILKKTVAFLLALVMVVTMVPLSALAMENALDVPAPVETIREIIVEETAQIVTADDATGKCGDNLYWSFDIATGTLTISGVGEMYDYTNEFPSWNTYFPIKELVVEEGVTTIGCWAFYLQQIKAVSLPSTLVSIGKHAFFACDQLEKVELPDTVTEIMDYAFAFCDSLTELIFPDSVTNLGEGVADYCKNLKKVILPSGITEIPDYSFRSCASLEYIDIPSNVTRIGKYAFLCSGLTNIVLPDSVAEIEYWAFFECTNLKSIQIPDAVRTIQHETFEGCTSLNDVYVGKGVTELEFGCFLNCENLSAIYFSGNAPLLIGNAPLGYGIPDACYIFSDNVYATVYYPANDPTWEKNLEQIKTVAGGANVTWLPYTPDDLPPEEDGEPPCALSELTELDYLAFSAIAYLPFASEGTVEENLKGNGYWDKVWSEDQGITYAELCDHIANWEVVTKHDLSSYNGFYAVSFGNKDKEIVIAYRGSVPPEQWAENDWDAVCDWLLNDLPIALGNTMGIQLDSALDIYENMALSHSVSQIAVTGHSLGGAWADAISAYSGCKGVTFNAVSILDVLYKHIPEKMAAVFEGVDRWQFVDHTNQYDVLAGMFEKYTSTKMKPYIAHKSNIPISVSIEELLEGLLDDAVKKNLDAVIEGSVSASTGTFMGFVAKSIASSVAESVLGDIAKCHGLQSFVVKTNDGAVKLTEEDHRFIPSKKITNYMLTANHSVDFGSTRKDEVDEDWTILVPRTSYGGNEDDKILTSWQNDHLIGGKGNADVLDGSWGDDVYIYYPGDGYDEIHDVSGNDTLKLCNTKRTDDVDCVLSDDGEYVYIYCAGEHIASIRAKNRAEGDNTFIIEWGDGIVTHVTSYLHRAKYSSAINIQCPVSVEILDAEGNAVYTLKDSEAGSFYTDYGNFYVCKEKNGSYSKTLDLVEGYTVKIIGEDEGTMDIAYRKVENGQLSEVQQLSDIPVSNGFTAVLEENETGEIQLTSVSDAHPYRLGDANHDGSINAKDSTRILQYSVGALDEAIFFCEDCAKVSNDDDINAKDSTLILQYSVGQRTEFPAQK